MDNQFEIGVLNLLEEINISLRSIAQSLIKPPAPLYDTPPYYTNPGGPRSGIAYTMQSSDDYDPSRDM